MGKLYCVCNEADETTCKVCPNFIMNKPDVKLNYSEWNKVIDMEKWKKFNKKGK